jgi:hypothetical protein
MVPADVAARVICPGVEVVMVIFDPASKVVTPQEVPVEPRSCPA